MRYRLLQPTTLNPGARLVLTQDQLRRRQGFVVPQADGWVLAVKPVSFKAGEIIELDGQLPKVLAAELLDADMAPAAATAPVAEPAPAPVPDVAQAEVLAAPQADAQADLLADCAADADDGDAGVETSALPAGGKRRGGKRS